MFFKHNNKILLIKNGVFILRDINWDFAEMGVLGIPG
jgi:hypothetical protein